MAMNERPGAAAEKSRIHNHRNQSFLPKVVGIVVVAAVIAIPNVPVGYLTPGAVFLGALAVYGTEIVMRRLA